MSQLEEGMPSGVTEITERDRELAQKCVDCKLCSYARRKQRGIAFWFTKNVEVRICPACRAYEKVYGRKAYEPELPEAADSEAQRETQQGEK